MKQRAKERSWRRLAANLLVVAGLLILLYPVGTWAYTYWQQWRLEQRLEESHPVLAAPVEDFFQGRMTPASDGRVETASVQAAQHDAQRTAFRKAADAFEESVGEGEGVPLAKLVIPKIGLETVVLEGVGRKDLREGPGHWPSTPFPGQDGNFVVSGHRTTYGAPFFRLDKLEPGDTMDLLLPYAAVRYKVTRKVIVLPSQVEEVRQRGFEQISLATCHPVYSAKQRLVIQGELLSFRLLEQEGEQATSGSGT